MNTTNLDGVVDATDKGLLVAKALGRDVLSTTGVANRKGYAGYEMLSGLAGGKWLARNRMLAADLGRWSRRDPIGYVDGPSLYQPMESNPLARQDPSGLDDEPNIPGDPPGKSGMIVQAAKCTGGCKSTRYWVPKNSTLTLTNCKITGHDCPAKWNWGDIFGALNSGARSAMLDTSWITKCPEVSSGGFLGIGADHCTCTNEHQVGTEDCTTWAHNSSISSTNGTCTLTCNIEGTRCQRDWVGECKMQ